MRKTITINNNLERISGLAQFIEALGEENNFSAKLIFEFNLALEEIITNIISYGYDDKEEHPITVTADIGEKEVVLTVEDDARPFNPLDRPEPDTTVPLEERQVGGLGIFFVRKFMDRVEYRRDGGKNLLLLVKNIPKDNP